VVQIRNISKLYDTITPSHFSYFDLPGIPAPPNPNFSRRVLEEKEEILMKQICIVMILFCVSFLVAGCATFAGPFVTNISSDGKGGIIVEKDTVRFDFWTSTISSGGTPTSSQIKLFDSK